MLGDDLTPEKRDRLMKIDVAASHLLSVVNDILDISKIEAGKVELEHVSLDISAILDNVRSLVSEQARAKGLAIEICMDMEREPFQGDPTRLQQALLNYVSNAVKFSERGVITLRATVQEDAGGEVMMRFEVQDQGIGIPADKIGNLFHSFEQADASTTRKYGGTGLGLAITRHLAELMGGESGAESEPGKGSRFWFTARLQRGHGDLPALASPGAMERAAAEMRQKHKNAKILLVEDYPLNQEIALAMLEESGLSIDVAGNGLEAVNMARETPYALILMDMQMPVMDGLEATRAIRAMSNYEGIPIVGLTANVYSEDRSRCFDAGMNDFIPKPIVQNDLYAILLKWLGGALARSA
jgi:CheY-like chemotaxis protein